jgi:signal transduction histidine kinase
MPTSDQHHMQNMNSVLATLREMSAAVMHAAEAHTVEEVLTRIAQVAKDLVRCRYAALGVPDGKGSLRFFKTAGMTPEEIAKIDHLPRGHGLLGAIMHERETLRLAHMRDDARSVGFPKHHPHMSSLLGVPITAGRQLFGMLYLCDRLDQQSFDDDDQTLVEILAGYAALAITGAEIHAQQGRLILLEERERVAMELHDGVIQSLYAIGMQLQLLRLNHSVSDEKSITDVIGSIDGVIEDVRDYIMNLRTVHYERKTIHESLSDTIARLHIPHDTKLHLDAPDSPPPFSPPVFQAVCQIAQEAISNAVRHGKPQNINVRVRHIENSFELLVEDDGCGFDMNGNTRSGQRGGDGLRNIRERARIHGGEVQIHSAPDSGTHVRLTLPVQQV